MSKVFTATIYVRLLKEADTILFHSLTLCQTIQVDFAQLTLPAFTIYN